MKDVILINYTGRKGGGALDAYEISKALINEGLPVVAVLSDQIENLRMWEKLKLEKLVTIPTYHNVLDAAVGTVFFSFKQRRLMLNVLKNYKVRYIFCPMGALWSHKINALFPDAKKGIVIHDPKPHSGDEWKSKLSLSDYDDYDHLFVHSKTFIDFVREKYKKPTSFMLLGTHETYKNCENKTSIIEYDSKKINFMFFGRIEKYKGLDVLGTAYEKVYNQIGNKITLTIIGSGDFSPYKAQYDNLKNIKVINRWIKDEEVESIFTGENIICICPYTNATQSGVVLIAMDYKVPLIATTTGGMTEQIENGVTGILVPPSDSKALTEAMIQLAENKEDRKKMKEEQEKHMLTMGWNVSARQLIEAMDIKLNN